MEVFVLVGGAGEVVENQVAHCAVDSVSIIDIGGCGLRGNGLFFTTNRDLKEPPGWWFSSFRKMRLYFFLVFSLGFLFS